MQGCRHVLFLVAKATEMAAFEPNRCGIEPEGGAAYSSRTEASNSGMTAKS
jgi:hypothetical protein